MRSCAMGLCRASLPFTYIVVLSTLAARPLSGSCPNLPLGNSNLLDFTKLSVSTQLQSVSKDRTRSAIKSTASPWMTPSAVPLSAHASTKRNPSPERTRDSIAALDRRLPAETTRLATEAHCPRSAMPTLHQPNRPSTPPLLQVRQKKARTQTDCRPCRAHIA